MEPSLGEYARQWLRAHAAHVAAGTSVRYAIYLHRHVLPALGRDLLRDVRPADVLALGSLLLEHGLAAGTVRAVLACLHTIYRAAEIDELVARNPVAHLVHRFQPAQGIAMTPAHEAAFTAHLPEHEHGHLFGLLLRSGLRLGEALGLQWADIDSKAATLHVCRQWGGDGLREHTKSGEDRTVDLTRGTLAMLAGLRRRDVPWIFPNPARDQPWHQATISRAFAAVCADAGLPKGRYTPHALRHTYATRLLELTGDVRYVQQQLGHKSVRITVDLYARGARRERPEALDLLDGERHGVRPARPPTAISPRLARRK